MPLVYIDFETHSEADIKKVGAKLYAEHPSTDIMCVAYAIDEHPPQLGIPDTFNGWAHSIFDGMFTYVAHNAFFEQCIWEAIMVKRYGFPPIPVSRWKCTMAKAYAHGLPGALGKVAAALELPGQKDNDGYAVMMKLCKPRKDMPGIFWTPETAPEDFAKLYKYCKQDVIVERQLDQTLRDLSPTEKQVWQIDQRINHQGVHLDVPAIIKAIEFSDRRLDELIVEFSNLTGGKIKSPRQRAAVKKWLADEHEVDMANTRKGTVAKLLNGEDLNDDSRRALELLQSASKSSLAKFPTMLQRSKNGLLREILVYHKGHTGRFAGSGVQMHNLYRPDGSTMNVNAMIENCTELSYEIFDLLYGDVAKVLPSALRGVVIPGTDRKFYIADFKQIELIIAAWVSGQEDVLEIFRSGQDLHQITADRMGIDRYNGKISNFALTYGGGIGALTKMAKQSGADLGKLWATLAPDDYELEAADVAYLFYLSKKPEEPVTQQVGYVADILKQRWRRQNDRIQDYWYATEAAAIEAMQEPFHPVTCGPVTWFRHNRYLYCRLPSGRDMLYPYPAVTIPKTGIGAGKQKLSYYGQLPQSKHWGRVGTYGGKLTENIVQAIARDCLCDTLRRLEDRFPVAFHVHDEVVCEVSKDFGGLKFDTFKLLAAAREPWSREIPLEVDAHEAMRYGKE